LLKDKDGKTAWQVAAKCDEVELLERLWNWAKGLQLNPEEIKNDVYLKKDKDGKTNPHMAAEGGEFEVLERLWDWAKELKLNPEEI